MKILKLLLLASIFVTGSSFSSVKPKTEPGEIIYSFGAGKMQCLSEINPEGEICILLKSLDAQTTVKFSRMNDSNPKKLILTAIMLVKEDTDLCASWTNMQEVHMALYPKPVETLTLSGTLISKKGHITILSAD